MLVGRARTRSLGRDRSGNALWHFVGAPEAILVQRFAKPSGSSPSGSSPEASKWERFQGPDLGRLLRWLAADEADASLHRIVLLLLESSGVAQDSAMTEEPPTAAAGEAASEAGRKGRKFEVGEEVQVDEANGVWSARVAQAKWREGLYRVSYTGWGPSFDAWVPSSALLANDDTSSRKADAFSSEALGGWKRLRFEATCDRLKASSLPGPHLTSWGVPQARCFARRSLRHPAFAALRRQPLATSLRRSLPTGAAPTADSVRAGELASLVLEVAAALPIGALDASWSEAKSQAFAKALIGGVHAPSPEAMADSVVALEHGLKSQWFLAQSLPAVRSLPSRAGALASANWPNLFLRVLTLDAALLYGKVQPDPGKPPVFLEGCQADLAVRPALKRGPSPGPGHSKSARGRGRPKQPALFATEGLQR